MSNQLYVQVPGWIGPREAARVLTALLGCTCGYYRSESPLIDAVRWESEDTSTADVGCFIRLEMTDPEGVRTRRGFFMPASGDPYGRRLLVVDGGPFWREVMGRLLATVGGNMRNEHHWSGPELQVRPARVRVDLEDGATHAWLDRAPGSPPVQ